MSMFKGAPKSEKQQQQDTWLNLSHVFGASNQQADKSGMAGNDALDAAANHFKALLSGDRTATADATAPATNALLSSADAAKREQAQMGTSRGGGTNAGNQQIASNTQGQIASLAQGARENAAKSLTDIGGIDINAMMNALGLSGSSSSALGGMLTSDINAKNAAASHMWSSLISGGLNLATAGGFGGLGSLFGKPSTVGYSGTDALDPYGRPVVNGHF